MSATFVSARSAFIEHAVPVLSGRAGSRSAANLGMPLASSLPADARHLDIGDRIDSVLLTADRWMESLRQLDIPDRPPRKVHAALQALEAGSAESVDLLIEATEPLLRELRKALLDAPQALMKSSNHDRDNLHQLCCDVGGMQSSLMQGNLAAGSAALPPGQFELFAVKECRNLVVHEGVSGAVAVRTVLTAWLYVLDRHWRELRARTDTLICRPFANGQAARFAPIRQDFLQPLAAAGRSMELARLSEWRNEAALVANLEADRGQIASQNAGKYVVVTGNEGAGKTRLLTMWLDQLANHGSLGREAAAVRQVAPWLPSALVWSAHSGDGVKQLLPCLRAQANTMLLAPLSEESRDTNMHVAGSIPTSSGEIWTPERAKHEIIALCEAVVREVGSCVVLLDGIDELQGQSGNRAVDDFVRLLPLHAPPGTLIVLGCRSATRALTSISHRRVVEELEVGPLERRDIESILSPLGEAATSRLDDVIAQTGGHAMHVVAARQKLTGPSAAVADLSNLDEEFVRSKIAEFSTSDADSGRPGPLPELLRFLALLAQFVDVPMDDIESWLKRRPCGYDVERVRDWIDRHGETIRVYRADDIERVRIPWPLVLKRARDLAGPAGREALMRELAQWVIEEVRDGDGVHEDTAFAVGQLFRTAPEKVQDRLLGLLDGAACSRPWARAKFPSAAMQQVWSLVEGWSADSKLGQIRFHTRALELARSLVRASGDDGFKYSLVVALQTTGENALCDEADGLVDELARYDGALATPIPTLLAMFQQDARLIDVSPHEESSAAAVEFLASWAEDSPLVAALAIERLREGSWSVGHDADTASMQLASNISRLTDWANGENEDLAKFASALLYGVVPQPELFRVDIDPPSEPRASMSRAVMSNPLIDYFKGILGNSAATAAAKRQPNGRGRFEVANPVLEWLRRLDRAASSPALATIQEKLCDYAAAGPYTVVRPLVGGWLMRIMKLDEAEKRAASIRALSEALALRGQRECWAARLALHFCPVDVPALIQLRPLAERWPEAVLPWWRVCVAGAHLLDGDSDSFLAMWQEIRESPRIDRVPWMVLPALIWLACLQRDLHIATAALEQHVRVEPGLVESTAIQHSMRAATALLSDDLPSAREHFTRYLAEDALRPSSDDGQPGPQFVPCRRDTGDLAFELRRDLTTTEAEAVWLEILEAVH